MSEVEKILVLWKSDQFPHRGNFFVRVFNHPDKITFIEGYMERPEIMRMLTLVAGGHLLTISKRYNKLKFQVATESIVAEDIPDEPKETDDDETNKSKKRTNQSVEETPKKRKK